MTETKRPLRVFLCHASRDKPAVIKLYEYLVNNGIDAWLDKEKLIPGQDWQIEIPKAVKNSDVVIVCLSPYSVTKEGFVQKEIKIALDAADEKPDGTIFIVPARLENCEVPERIGRFHWVDLFLDDGYERLVKALQLRAENLGISIKHKRKPSKSSSENTPKIIETRKLPPYNSNNDSQNLVNKPSPSEIEQFEKEKNFFVFFANEKKANSISKMILFNDIGGLKIEKHYISFKGVFSNFSFPLTSQFSITRQTFPWIGFVLANIFSVLFLIAFYGMFYYTNGQDPVLLSTGVLIGLIVLFSIILVVSNIMGAVMWLLEKWVKIEYKDEIGRYHSVYVADAKFLGYSVFFGGTVKIYNALLAQKNYLSKYRA